MIKGWWRHGRAAFRKGSLFLLLTQCLAWWGGEAKTEEASLPLLPQQLPSLPSASDSLTPTVWGQNPNTSGSYRLSLYKPCCNSLGKGYLEIALAWLSEWANCETRTQTSFGNPEESQACSLAHVIPYLGLENVPALTRTHHGVTVSDPQNPKDPLRSMLQTSMSSGWDVGE